MGDGGANDGADDAAHYCTDRTAHDGAGDGARPTIRLRPDMDVVGFAEVAVTR